MDYYSNIIPAQRADSLARAFTKVLESIVRAPDVKSKDIQVVHDEDVKLYSESQSFTGKVESCSHWKIQEQIENLPESPAIASWDRSMTYKELGMISAGLARKLIERGVGPEKIVPLCFPKSAWAVIAMVAVQFAGGAFVALDPKAPTARIQSILADCEATLVISSPEYGDRMREAGVEVITIDETSADETVDIADLKCPDTTPDNASFVNFTSGSTGKPKGMVMTHSSICSTAGSYGEVLHVGPDTRVLQFSAYTFDVGIMDVLVTLMRGATICIPSDDERVNDLAGAINRLDANWAFLTPTVADLLNPQDVPGFETLILGGEAVGKKTVEKWRNLIPELHGIYGPAEASCCSWNPDLATSAKSTVIGRPIASAFWVVDPSDPKQLVPDGCIGELLIQGPMLARGYMNVEPKVQAVWLEDLELPNNPWYRGYCTGDLVRRNADGLFEYVGRKDTQVKLHGQRIEMGEIETTLRGQIPDRMGAIVDVVKSRDSDNAALAAFLWFTNTQAGEHAEFQLLDSIKPETRDLIASLNVSLQKSLPAYMIPSTYLMFQGKPPKTVTGKIDRRALVALGNAATVEEQRRFTTEATHNAAPTTAMELRLRKIWAEVLSVSAKEIGKEDNFLQIGGDSISAIKMVSVARQNGITLTVATIFENLRLDEMATAVNEMDTVIADGAEYEAFSLLDVDNLDQLKSDIIKQCGLTDKDAIEDAYPCTGFQEGLMALAVKQPGSYMAKYAYSVPEHVDEQVFQAAWEKTVQHCSNLRTRIVQVGGQTIQALIKGEEVVWENQKGEQGTLREAMESTQSMRMRYGSKLCRYILTQEPSGERHFVLVVHHAVFDGWSLNLVIDTLVRAYQELELPAMAQYATFIKYTTSMDEDAAREYWREQLREATRASFPPVPSVSSTDPKAQTKATRTMKRRIPFPWSSDSTITKATVLRTAWAIVLARYSNSSDVCFGTTVSGRNAPVEGIESMAGPAVATVPVRVQLDASKPAADVLQAIQTQASEMVQYEQFGLSKISKVAPEAKEACNFSSLLVIQPMQSLSSDNSAADPVSAVASVEDYGTDESLEGYFTYPLVVQSFLFNDYVDLALIFDCNTLQYSQIDRLAQHFENVVRALLTPGSTDGAASSPTADWGTAEAGESDFKALETTHLGNISLESKEDLRQATEWNGDAPEVLRSCVHELVTKQALERPDAPAITAWDGEVSYSQLDATANRVAHHLVTKCSVSRGDLVHVCFEKSVWFFVAMLAINKAGGAWVPIDPSHPLERQKQIAGLTGSKLTLASGANAALCRKITPNVLVIDAALDEQLKKAGDDHSARAPRSGVSSSDAAYVLFTSGSTGVPKGLVMQHGAVCTSQTAVAKRLRLTPEVRILQFAAYVFDLCIGEIIGPLTSGACLCVPSEHTRMNRLKDFIKDKNINWAFLTPAFARTLRPEDAPSLELLLLAGEAVGHDVFKTWFGKVRFVNGWGPAETCVFSTLQEWESADESPLTVGRPVGGNCWIVDPDDASKLAPIGCLGEIVLQGPTLLREYLGDPERTADSTVTELPVWAPNKSSPAWSRFFKSGDLGCYNPDGTIQFASRKDTQVKIRGLRVELGEVEHHVRAAVPESRQVIVDVFKMESGTVLAAYFCATDSTRMVGSDVTEADVEDAFIPMSPELQETLRAGLGQLTTALPSYMVPTLFIPCRFMPSIISTKLDRRGLQKMTGLLTREQLNSYALSEGEKRAVATDMEAELQKVWANILNVPAESIGRDDSFLRIGGDSITAIRMITAARDAGIQLSVQDVFDDPRLMGLAAKAAASKGPIEDEKVEAFEMLPVDELEQIKSNIVEQCGLKSADDIEDAYPCTALQEGLMALAVKKPGSYMARYKYSIPSHVSEDRFKDAWRATMERCGNLRTRIILVEGKTVQALVTEGPSWDTAVNGDIPDIEMKYGSRLCRYALASDNYGERTFVLAIHHAVFDGWSLNLVMDTFVRIYRELELSTPKPYASFIKYIEAMEEDAASQYWTEQLQDVKRASFPPTKSGASTDRDDSVSTQTMRRSIDFPWNAESSITKATVLRAAWAIVLARYSETDDICFGTTVSGRHAPVAGVESIAGPLVATVPVRIRLESQSSVQGLLESVQTQGIEMVTYEQFGLRKISNLSIDAKDACDFSSLLVIQPLQALNEEDEANPVVMNAGAGDQGLNESLEGYFTYPLVVQGFLDTDRVELAMIYDSTILSEQRIQALSQHFEGVVQHLLTRQSTTLKEVSLASDWDLEQAVEWNGEPPEIVSSCVHQLIEKQALERPDMPAISAWDAALSYREFNEAANRLAHHLVEQGTHRGDLVHVCFEKSAWFFVSILAINKAGAAWVPLDPSHPEERKRQVISQTGAALALVSKNNADMIANLVSKTITVDQNLDQRLKDTDADQSRSVKSPDVDCSPADAVYVLFTSGSTGVPKGLVMEHGSVCTSQTAICKRLNLTSDVRMLQFASYVFDLCIGEIIAPLISGACLCVPSDHTRMNGLKEFVQEKGINWAFLTPAFARTLRPADMPGLELLLLAGEAVGRDVLDTWFGRVRLINGWGPAETCVFSTLHEWQAPDESPLTVGQPVGGSCWIVDSEDPSTLAPTSCVGEIVIQGPTILREYLGDREKTAAATVVDLPEWTPRRNDMRWNRFFKSGDLGRYNSDGTIEFSSRKDTQVKIRGLRVELGEVEHHVRAGILEARQVVVDVYTNETSTNLAAYFCSSDETRVLDADASAADVFLPITSELQDSLTAMAGQLAISLPNYMVPTFFVPCKYMPSITSTKLDRNGLKGLMGQLGQQDLESYALSGGEKRKPATEMETRLQEVWSKILKLSASDIGRDDSFLRIGGDSISAIRLVTAAREVGIGLTVQNIFDDPRLIGMAAKATEQDPVKEGPIAPFSLLVEGEEKIADLKTAVAERCDQVTADDVEDAYPCTALQEGLLALAVKQPGSYMAKYAYKIPKNVDIERFRQAWEKTIQNFGNLRTRIVEINGKTVQALVKELPEWETTEDGQEGGLRRMIDALGATEMQYGTRLCRYALTQEPNGERHFALVLHHSIFDGWSLNLIMDGMMRAYRDLEPQPIKPYSGFIKFASGLDKASARSYWRDQLKNAKKATFPAVNKARAADSDVKERAKFTRTLKRSFPFNWSKDSSVTKATLLRAAWAVVLARYCDSDDVCFGTTVSGRQAPVAGIENMAGPAVATVPVRIHLEKQKQKTELLNAIQSQAAEMVQYEQFGLNNITKLSEDIKDACDFSSLLIIQPLQSFTANTTDGGDGSGDSILTSANTEIYGDEETVEGYFTYPLVIQGNIHEDRVELHLIYHSDVIAEQTLNALMRHLENVVQQLLDTNEHAVADIPLASDWDLEQATEWNGPVAPPVHSTAHDLVSQRTSRTPDHEAVVSSEARFTYAELDRASSRLAQHLSELGVGIESMVACCMEKSPWMIVAMLAAMQAGGVYVPIEPSHPAPRRKALLESVGAKVLLVTPQTAKSCAGMADHIVEISQHFMSDLLERTSDKKIEVEASSSNAAYVIFTSGSTGKPKTIVVEHTALCASIHGHGRSYSLDGSSRVLQFSNYVFDVSIGEILTTLVFGGTVCVPNDKQRLQDTVGFINDFKVNTAFLTPSFASTFGPDQVPTLRTLIVGGEAPTKESMRIWYGRVELINGYGPAEAVVYCGTHVYRAAEESPRTIGKCPNGHSWVVEPENHNRLAPIGCVGELMIHGHALARGYAGDEATSANSFLDSVDFLPSKQPDDKRRFYKTGDLVKYLPDGRLEYLGRRDGQAKLRGQRLELGEIEHAMKECMSVEQVAVDVVKKDKAEALVGFVQFGSGGEPAGGADVADALMDMDDNIRTSLQELAAGLKQKLPRYMVPALLLPLRWMPFGTSQKLDRKRLREMAEQMSRERVADFALGSAEKKEPSTPMELALRDVWAQVLDIEAKSISVDDSFLLIGGDSISAIRLVSAAREAGITFSVSDIFEDARLGALAAKAKQVDGTLDDETLEPFSLLNQDQLDGIEGNIAKQCQLAGPDVIEDAYPCTGLQEGLMALAVKQPGSYIAKHVYRLPEHIDQDRFRAAWTATVQSCTNLRTRIANAEDGTILQAVIKEAELDWEPEGTLQQTLDAAQDVKMQYGSRLCRYALTHESSGARHFVMMIHHAVFDGWSLNIVLDTLVKEYKSQPTPTLRPYSSFIKYTSSISDSAATKFWTKQLHRSGRASFPPAPKSGTKKSGSHFYELEVKFPYTPSASSITQATILRTAFGAVLSRYSDSEDVTFGATVSGRQAPLPGVDAMPGPAIATVPVRLRFEKDRSMTKVLRDVQKQTLAMVPYEQWGLSRIGKVSPEAREACDFSSLLVVQPGQHFMNTNEDEGEAVLVLDETDKEAGRKLLEGYFSYPLVLQCFLKDGSVELRFQYDPGCVNDTVVKSMARQVDHVLQQLLRSVNKKGSSKEKKEKKELAK